MVSTQKLVGPLETLVVKYSQMVVIAPHDRSYILKSMQM